MRALSTLRRCLLLLIGVAAAACASAPPAAPPAREVPPPSAPDPAALSHFIDARFHEARGQRDQAITALRAAIAIDTTSATLYGALARNLAAEGRYSAAVHPARKALDLDGDDLETRWTYYESLLAGVRDTATALSQLEVLARLDPEPLKAFDRMLKIYDARGDNAGVIRTLDRITELPGTDENVRLIAATNYRQRGATAKAERLIRLVLRDNPARSDAWVRLANLQVTRGDTLGGARSLRMALQNRNNRVNTGHVWRELVKIYGPGHRLNALLSEDPPDTGFIEQLGEVYRQFARSANPQESSQLLERALVLFRHLGKLAPSRADLFAKQGELLLNLNRPMEAREAFNRATEIDNRPEYHLGTAHTLLFERLYDPAIEILERIKPLTPPESEFFDKTILSLGNAYGATGRVGDARKLYAEAIETAPGHTAFRYELGETYIREGEWSAAADAFRDLLPRVEEDPVALGQTLYGLARTLERAGEFDESVRTFERLLSLHPKHADALNYLGYMFAERGVRLGEAENYIKRALEADPDNGAYLDSLGWVYYQAGDYTRAQEFLKRAIAEEEKELRKVGKGETARLKVMRENLAVIYDHAGDCALALNQFEEARRRWEQALESDPNIEKTRQKLDDLIGRHFSPPEGDSAR